MCSHVPSPQMNNCTERGTWRRKNALEPSTIRVKHCMREFSVLRVGLSRTVCRSLRFQPWEVNGLGRAYEKEATGSSRVWDALELLKTYFFDPNLHLYTLWAVHPATESSGKWADAANIQNGVLLAATRASWSWEVLWGLIRQHCIHQGGQALAGSAVTKGNGQLTIHLLVGISKLIFANLRILYCMDLWSHSASQIS